MKANSLEIVVFFKLNYSQKMEKDIEKNNMLHLCKQDLLSN